jgi:NAD(P)-dependent dehydrogenase (short-subunit alcohol dehydrogenase family)
LPIPDLTDRAIADLVSLEGRVAIVTGATNGTGAGIALRLAQAGPTVVITHRDAGTASDAAESMAARGLSIHGFGLDVREESSFIELVSGVVNDLGPIGIWVNNAGIYRGSSFLDMTAAEWDEVLDHNLRSAFLGSRTAAQHMVQAGRGGVIVNVGSTATPTFTETEGTRARRADLDDDAYRRYIDKVGATKPLRRVGVPDDVARGVLFCASDLSSFMTGATLPVDGGDLA